MQCPNNSPAQGFFRMIKYKGLGVGGGANPTNPPPIPIKQKFRLVVRDSASQCIINGGPPFIVGDPIYCLPPSPCSRLCPPSVKQSIGGLRLRHFQKLLLFFRCLFSLSVKRRCLQVWCQGRPRGSLAGRGTIESRRERQRVT